MSATKREIPVVRQDRKDVVRIRKPGHRLDGRFGELVGRTNDGKLYVMTIGEGSREYTCILPAHLESVGR